MRAEAAHTKWEIPGFNPLNPFRLLKTALFTDLIAFHLSLSDFKEAAPSTGLI